MKRSTSNKLNMYQSVSEVLNENQVIWEGVPAFSGAVINFSNKLDLLRNRVSEQLSTTTGVSLEKQIKIDELRKRIMVMQRALMLHGRTTGNVTLLERNRKSKTSLRVLSTGKLAARCVELKLDLETYGSQLIAYGISQEAIESFLSVLISVNEINSSTRKAIIKRKNITQSIEALEHALDDLLRIELDSLILVFEAEQPEFFNHFVNSRTIVDHGHSHTPPAPDERDDGGQEV